MSDVGGHGAIPVREVCGEGGQAAGPQEEAHRGVAPAEGGAGDDGEGCKGALLQQLQHPQPQCAHDGGGLVGPSGRARPAGGCD